jgi:hypothetical protein
VAIIPFKEIYSPETLSPFRAPALTYWAVAHDEAGLDVLLRDCPLPKGLRGVHRARGDGRRPAALHLATVDTSGPIAAMAARSLRRWPIEVTPMPIRSSAVRSGRTSPSTSLSRNASSYRSRPSS